MPTWLPPRGGEHSTRQGEVVGVGDGLVGAGADDGGGAGELVLGVGCGDVGALVSGAWLVGPVGSSGPVEPSGLDVGGSVGVGVGVGVPLVPVPGVAVVVPWLASWASSTGGASPRMATISCGIFPVHSATSSGCRSNG